MGSTRAPEVFGVSLAPSRFRRARGSQVVENKKAGARIRTGQATAAARGPLTSADWETPGELRFRPRVDPHKTTVTCASVVSLK